MRRVLILLSVVLMTSCSSRYHGVYVDADYVLQRIESKVFEDIQDGTFCYSATDEVFCIEKDSLKRWLFNDWTDSRTYKKHNKCSSIARTGIGMLEKDFGDISVAIIVFEDEKSRHRQGIYYCYEEDEVYWLSFQTDLLRLYHSKGSIVFIDL